MARPAKSVEAMSQHLSKEEKESRKEKEEKLKGLTKDIKPASYLTADQKEIFEFIVKNLEASGILGGLDAYVLETTVIAIDRLQKIESMINEDIEKLTDRALMSSKEKYTKDLWRGCNELSLSPQSRAKLANINVQTQKTKGDTLLNILSGEDDE